MILKWNTVNRHGWLVKGGMGVQAWRLRKHEIEIVISPKVPPSVLTFWSGLEVQTIRGVRGAHAYFPTKSGAKTKTEK